MSHGPVIQEGWVLKKRRKRMQGFARRYFVLYQSGLLCYSFEPGKPIRDQIPLHTAAISSTPGRKDITIDSSRATFHIKCLTTEDFTKWMTAFRKFISTDDRTVGRRSSVARNLPFLGYITKAGVVAEEMGTTIEELEDAFFAWSQEHSTRRRPSSSRGKGDQTKQNHSKDMFGLFKKSNHHHDSPSENEISPSSSGQSTHSPEQRIQAAIITLKSQHTTLVKSISSLTNTSEGPSTATLRSSPLPSTREEDAGEAAPTPTRSGARTPWTGSVKRASIADTASDGTGSVWFDAPEAETEGAEEYIVEHDSTPLDENGGGSKMSSTTSQTSSSVQDTEDDESETDSEDEVDAAEWASAAHGMNGEAETTGSKEIVRRTQLPSPPVGDEGSLFAVLKKNVGKDLSSVALPVTFNEPLTLLQRAAEEMEYYDLLRQAAESSDPVERMCFVAAFAVSGYAHTRYRTGRKGFNPMLAETFEDSRMKFIAEKVSHQPVVMAYHAEGATWRLDATSAGKTKFWGKSLEIIPLGTTHVQIGEDHFQWNKPSSFMRNLMMGTKYLEHCGKMVVENTRTKAKCVLEFKEAGYWGTSNQVAGTVFSPDGKAETHLEGKWDDSIVQKMDASHLRILWRIAPFPKNAPEYYGFTYFGITLNEITPDLEGKLPPTDSRFRTDVRALEEGNMERAEAEKLRIEERQRERRRAGKERRPRWFKQVGDEWVYAGGYWEERSRGWKDVDPLW
ncbi:hypothetical protein GLOTRDRAFT_135500 [Gloeophyllum trabeum ATCC 11539]|uniref:PH domain-containing protein n=1 Tax=Gloeophyllum trabeum (strain ATCC 11539 / FP-39264 / Madison 617) TaxID=670483 RepID=S7QMW5_GLOTA|nr:uncharacterized protein GLOTRDRAFT_135500 [Gloeophyllum trabeum ATCC 11539]EPQ60901.1 hypothetical protein GLOTRDRAFT_135500 [Gloeophyllum trabeum ATCC 11539]